MTGRKSKTSIVGVLSALMLGGIVSISAGDPNDAGPSKHLAPQRKKGWSWAARKDAVQPDCGRRNPVFAVGDPITFALGPSAATYEVRNYWGDVVDEGPAGTSIALKVSQPGWYKLYVYGKAPAASALAAAQERETGSKRPQAPGDDAIGKILPASRSPAQDGEGLSGPMALRAAPKPIDPAILAWGDVVGGTAFVILRKNANFPELPPKNKLVDDLPGDEVMRGVSGMGPQRHSANAGKPEQSIAELDKVIAVDRAMYVPFDPVRKRVLMIAFPGGTKGKEDGVRKIVEHFKDVVAYYEPRNEPNYGSSGADFAAKEMKPFFETVKGVDRRLKVMGPGTVAVNPSLLPWIEDFLKEGGADMIDAFSFHFYNGINGDLVMGRRSMDNLLALLKKYGADKKELWQTEQGFFAAMYGVYQPRHQGRWTMLEMMLFDQYGLPREHNHLWYDKSHGFWNFPTWWENGDGGFNPALPLMRVLAEEQFGTTLVRAFDFGEPGNRLYIGSLFESPDGAKAMAMFMSAGSPDGKVPLKVSGGDRLHVVSAFGVEADLPVRDGLATLPVPELPVYVELARGQKIEPVPTAWGRNLARDPGVTAVAANPPAPPTNPKNPREVKAAQGNVVSKIINGEQENWYYAQQPGEGPWMDNATALPTWVEIRLPAPATVARVVIYATPPWQSQGTLLDYELQYESGGRWVTIEHVREPTRTVCAFTPPTRTSVDSFFSDRWIFQHEFSPITAEKLRRLVHDVTWGGGATKEETEAGGQTGPHQMTLREVEIYGK